MRPTRRRAGTGGAGGQTVQASTGTAIHTALCTRASSSTPIIIQVSGTINHGNTTKVSGDSCNTTADKIELKEISNVTIVRERNAKSTALVEREAALTKAREQEALAHQQEALAQRRFYAAQINLAYHAWEDGDVGRVADLLESQRPPPGVMIQSVG